MALRGKLSKNDIETIIAFFCDGYPCIAIARAYGVDHSSIYYHLKRNNVERTFEAEARAVEFRKNKFIHKQIQAKIERPDIEVEDLFVIGPTKQTRNSKPKSYKDYLKERATRLEVKLQNTTASGYQKQCLESEVQRAKSAVHRYNPYFINKMIK